MNRRRTETAASLRARKAFTFTVLERDECEVQRYISHACGGGWVDACHILPKQFIRRETNLWAEPEALAALWNPDNALCGCRTGHNLFDAPGHGVQWWQLPAPAIEFAESHGWLWKLERDYPDCAGAAGTDLDGDPTPRHLAYPDIVDFALRAVRELRRDYDEGLGEAALVAPAVTTGLEMNTNPEGDENLD